MNKNPRLYDRPKQIRVNEEFIKKLADLRSSEPAEPNGRPPGESEMLRRLVDRAHDVWMAALTAPSRRKAARAQAAADKGH